jgi:hypothetical protein
MEGVYGYLIRKTHLKSLLNSEKYAVIDKLRGKKTRIFNIPGFLFDLKISF